MLRTKIPLAMAGVYLYKAGKQVWLDEVNRELVLVLTATQSGVCGVVVYPHPFVRGELFDLLNALKTKICGELGIAASGVTAKIFGCSSGQTNALFATQVWLTDQGFSIAAVDTGRNVTRSVVVDTVSGKVGVRFADAENGLGAGFLKAGTAALRVKTKERSREAVVVTDNRNFATLAAQSLENQRDWTVKILSSADLLQAPKKFRVGWLKTASTIVVLEDVLEAKNLAKTIVALKKKSPQIQWLWSISDGTEVPLPLNTVVLPSADDTTSFGTQVNDSLNSLAYSPGTVIKLARKKSR
jgi:hypothetical protein